MVEEPPPEPPMEDSTYVTLGAGIPLGLAAVALKAGQIKRTYQTRTRSEVAASYVVAAIVAAVALVALVVAAVLHPSALAMPLYAVVLTGYEAAVIVECLFSDWKRIQPRYLRGVVFLAAAALYWNLQIKDNRLLMATATPLMVFHGFFDLFVLDLT